MKLDIEKLRELPRKSSKDYLELMHLALEMNDKEWFEELAKEKTRLEKLEEETRRELGWKG
jgi:hypothetical protein